MQEATTTSSPTARTLLMACKRLPIRQSRDLDSQRVGEISCGEIVACSDECKLKSRADVIFQCVRLVDGRGWVNKSSLTGGVYLTEAPISISTKSIDNAGIVSVSAGTNDEIVRPTATAIEPLPAAGSIQPLQVTTVAASSTSTTVFVQQVPTTFLDSSYANPSTEIPVSSRKKVSTKHTRHNFERAPVPVPVPVPATIPATTVLVTATAPTTDIAPVTATSTTVPATLSLETAFVTTLPGSNHAMLTLIS